MLPAALAMATDMAANVAPMFAALSKRLLWDTAIHGYDPTRVAELETELHLRSWAVPAKPARVLVHSSRNHAVPTKSGQALLDSVSRSSRCP
ncbi:hypothetical protein [Nocardia gipuzkoensis]|uniref:hypothetical protein n=1 Tax=Nocardia gipuzkoensis TaxID=2749991 RepID=UPI0015EF5CB2